MNVIQYTCGEKLCSSLKSAESVVLKTVVLCYGLHAIVNTVVRILTSWPNV